MPTGNKDPKADVDQAMRDLREKGHVKAPGEIGHQVRVIKRSDLRAMMEELVRRYGGMANAELIEKIGLMERELITVRAEAEAREKGLREDMERRLQAGGGMAEELERRLAALTAENERLSAELGAAMRALTSADAKRCLELEKRVLELQARILELEMGLDYFGLEQEPEATRLREALEGAGRRSGAAGTEVGARARAAEASVALLQAQMYEGKGTVGVVVELAKALERRRGVELEASTVSRL